MDLWAKVPECMFDELMIYFSQHTNIRWAGRDPTDSYVSDCAEYHGISKNGAVIIIIVTNPEFCEDAMYIYSLRSVLHEHELPHKSVGINKMFQKETYLCNGFRWKE